MRYLTETERRRRVNVLLSQVTAVEVKPAAAQTTPAKNVLSPAAANVLIKCALEPATLLLQIYAALSLHAAEGKRAVDELLARGYVRTHRLARKGRGGQPTILEVRATGVAELARRGISPAKRLIARGGHLHDVYGRFIQAWLRAQGVTRMHFEKTLGEKAFDVLYEDASGLHGVEICLSGTAEWTAAQMIKAASVAGVVDVVMACEKASFMKLVTAQLQQIDALGLYRPKIKPMLLADYLTDRASG